MAIIVDEKTGLFQLITDNTEYQMKADKYGVLRHLWYGEKTGCDMEYLQSYSDVGFSGNIYDAGNDRTYSLDTLPLEYACDGVGDYRVTGAAAVHSDGSCALDLRYKGYRISKGKYSIKGLPAVYADVSESETLEIVLKDKYSDIEVTLRYGVLPKLDIITKCVSVANNGTQPVILTKVASLCLDIPHGEWEWVHFHGRHAMERLTERMPLCHGIQESSSKRGTSSHHQNPTVLLCSPDCTETSGSCIGAALMYSGSFQTKIQLDQMEQVRLVMGINPELFRWELKPSEVFDTPEVIMSYSSNGMEKLSHNFHKVIREHVCRGKYKLAERPVLINNWEATYFDFNEEKILKIAEQAASLGVDMLVLDDGWFGKRDDDCSGLGDWFVSEEKLNGGLGKLAEKIISLGMKFGLWFEPEMVSEDSDLYRSHPDWAIKIPSRNPVRSRYQLVLDMINPEVRDYLFGAISDIRINNIFPHYSFSRSSSAISLILRSLWFTPDFPTGGSRYVPSSLSGVSGYSNRSNAISFRFSGRLSKPAFCLIYSISPSCFTAAATVLLIFAVSQFTFRLTEFLISFKIRTFSRFISATCASMIFNISTIWAPSFKYTTWCFFRSTIFASISKLLIAS